MTKMTVCRVLNTFDKNTIFLCAKWSEEDVKITILRNEEVPLIGSVSISELVEVAENFKKTKDEFLNELQIELAGQDDEVQFTLKNSILRWKKKIWNHGQVKCEKLSDTIQFSDEVAQILTYYSDLEKNFSKLTKESENLKRINEEITKTMQILVDDKKNIENNIIKQCIPLLNSKKKRIRELEEENKRLKRNKNVFEQSTDESDDEYIQSKKFKKEKKLTSSNFIFNLGSSSSDDPKNFEENKNQQNKVENHKRNFSMFENIVKVIENECSSPEYP